MSTTGAAGTKASRSRALLQAHRGHTDPREAKAGRQCRRSRSV